MVRELHGFSSLHCFPTPASILHYIQELLPDSTASVLGEEAAGLRDTSDLVSELDRAIGEPQTSHCDYISSGMTNTLQWNLSNQAEGSALISEVS